MLSQHAKAPADPKPVVAKAFYRAADALFLSRQEVRDIMGFSEATISRHRNSLNRNVAVSFDKKNTELGLFFLRMYRSLLALFGGSEETARKWFDANNTYLNGKPRELVQKIGGLVNVAEYLDAMRAKV